MEPRLKSRYIVLTGRLHGRTAG